MSRSPNVQTKEACNVRVSAFGWETVSIPAGSYVKPIEIDYVPKHLIEDDRFRAFNSKLEVFCYTKFGMFPILRSNLIEV